MLTKDSSIPELKIDKIVPKGLGLGFYRSSPVFVYQGLPGDNVSVRIVHKRGDVYFAEIESYNKRADYQLPVECEAFRQCGGCEWLHVPYEKQLKFKQGIINEVFEKICPDINVIKSICPSPKKDFYRNKIFLPVAQSGKELITGMYARRSHKVIPHHQCRLQPAKSAAIVRRALSLLNRAKVSCYDEKRVQGTMRYIGLRYSAAEDNYLTVFVTNGRKLPFTKVICSELMSGFPEICGIVQNVNSGNTNRILGEETKLLHGSEFLTEMIGTISYKTHYSSFFQVNPYQTKKLFDFVKEQLTPEEIVVDAFSGIGAVGIYIAESVKEVVCLEQHEQSVRDGEDNCRINRIDNCRFISCQVEEKIRPILQKTSASTVILDPPRKGVEKEVLRIIAESKVNKIVYISCDIATQKRDLDLLIKDGFHIKTVQPFDMFPHTYHIENVTLLLR